MQSRPPAARTGRPRSAAADAAILAATREALVDGFADAKVSVCFPSSMTHPARSAHVETVTHRYFESMASGCIIIGRCPSELRDLFGYNPLVEADVNGDAAGQIEAIVRDPCAYAPLVARNRARLMEVGTWHARVATLLSILVARGYALDKG